jgi:hypothetical protein
MSAPSPPTKTARIAHKTVVWGGVLAIIAVYLFATRPEPLGEGGGPQSNVPIETVFRMVASENDAVRALWTADIVGAGTKAGLKFDEKWHEPNVAAGPLPALFLREAANALQKARVPLGLFLGSDYPIAQSNLFSGEQAQHFKKLRETGEPAFFHAADIGRHTAMFADLAVAPGCVSCHNEHPNSPKTDWKSNDIMGATTWSYPKDKVTTDEALQILASLRTSFAAAYDAYLAKISTIENPPEIGQKWPKQGYAVPARQVFLQEFERRASAKTVDRLINLTK